MDTRKSWSERLGGNEIGIDADLDGRIEKKGTRATQLSLDLDESKLHERQVQVIHGAKLGEDIFITGPGGTGKSHVMKIIIDYFKSKYEADEWAIVAPTGIAALAVGGQTIHSFAGCGVPQLVKDFDRCWGKKAKERWRSLKVLMIDEISMLSGEFLDHLIVMW